MPRGLPRFPPILLTAAALVVLPPPSAAQDGVRVRVEENFRREPNGEVLGVLAEGARLALTGRRDRWREVTLEGWVWERSLQISDGGALGLVVSVEGGENLRAEPSGTILARLGRGTLLEEVERAPGWIRVRRSGWVWGPSVEEDEDTGTRRAVAPEATPPPPGEGGFTSAAAGAAVLSAPDGDTLAHTAPGAEVELLARRGSWARVRIEGWVWLPEEADEGAEADEAAALVPSDLVAAPDAHRGRVLTWRLQFISLERAERVRTDFYEGEPFLLCRFGGAEGDFVYVAVPPDRMADVEGILPLESIQVTGRVRTGASALTASPVLDLLSLERGRRPR